MNYTITINRKNILIGITLLALIGTVFFGGIKHSSAISDDYKLIGNKDFVFHIFNTPGLPEGQVEIFNLPSPQGHNGDIHVFKAAGSGGAIRPQAGISSINLADNNADYNVLNSTAVILVADALNDTWWVISQDNSFNY